MRRIGLLGLLLSCGAAAGVPLLDGGHLKGRAQLAQYPDDSLFRQQLGEYDAGAAGVARLRFTGARGGFSFNADYQLIAQYAEPLALPVSGGSFYDSARAPDDQRRWWDLTDVIERDEDFLLEQRLDRLNLTWTSDKAVVRFGRQAVSWGNGLIYTPMDFLNPFDPAAVDTEYKAGDDMLYAQYLLDSGDDLQFVNVQRRDAQGDVSQAVSSTALKFHGFAATREYDLLLAQHYDEAVIGAGGLLDVGEAVVRGDLVLSDSDEGWKASLVLDWTWSWAWRGRNFSAVAEYFFNGFGLRESDYDLAALETDDELARRLARGELFTIGRHYAAGSLLLEWTPLLNLTGNLFYNLGDGSALAQGVAQWDLAQNWQLLGALNLPLGPEGTEYGGLETAYEGLTLGTGPSLFLQLAWYF
ncbi:hypothetical protein [Haliea sp. E17]|uniref:hypothetical protein n=1 Tax=Haliea sp. E17 TaxID=3401576 RepID=UPI003AAAE379